MFLVRYHLVSCLDDAFLQTKRSFARYHLPKSQNVYFFWFQSCPCGFPFSKFSGTWVLGLPKFSFVCFFIQFQQKDCIIRRPTKCVYVDVPKSKGKNSPTLNYLEKGKMALKNITQRQTLHYHCTPTKGTHWLVCIL